MKSIIASVLLYFIMPSAVSAITLKLVGEPYCPYICDGKQKGVMIEILNIIFKDDIKIEYYSLPWSRALKQLDDGKADGIVAIIKETSPLQIYPKEEVGIVQPCFFTTKETSWKYTGIESLSKVKLGIVQDYGYDAMPEFSKYIKSNSSAVSYIVGYDPTIRRLKMLESERLDAIFEDYNVVKFVANQNNFDNFKLAGCLSARVPLYIGFSNKNINARKYAEKFDDGIKILRKNGKLAQILKKYGISDWK